MPTVSLSDSRGITSDSSSYITKHCYSQWLFFALGGNPGWASNPPDVCLTWNGSTVYLLSILPSHNIPQHSLTLFSMQSEQDWQGCARLQDFTHRYHTVWVSLYILLVLSWSAFCALWIFSISPMENCIMSNDYSISHNQYITIWVWDGIT